MKAVSRAFLGLALAVVLAGCGGGGGNPFQMAVALNVKNSLHFYRVASLVYQTEHEGQYGTLRDVCTENYIGKPEILAAWDGAARPVPLAGYLFGDVTTDSNGKPMNPRMKVAFVAYPAKKSPGKGDPIYLLIGDMSRMVVPAHQTGPVNTDDEWTFYEADSKDITLPLTTLPSDADLAKVWKTHMKRTPEQAVQDAQKLYDQAR